MSDPHLPADSDARYLMLLKRTRHKAMITMFGCFIAVFCLLSTVFVIRRTDNRQALPSRSDFIGILLGASAFSSLVGSALSVWLVMDTSAEYRRLHQESLNKLNQNQELP